MSCRAAWPACDVGPPPNNRCFGGSDSKEAQVQYVGIDWAYRRAAWCALREGGEIAGEGVGAGGRGRVGQARLAARGRRPCLCGDDERRGVGARPPRGRGLGGGGGRRAEGQGTGAVGVIAVGTAVANGPPRRSQRALLTHWAPALGSGVEARF